MNFLFRSLSEKLQESARMSSSDSELYDSDGEGEQEASQEEELLPAAAAAEGEEDPQRARDRDEIRELFLVGTQQTVLDAMFDPADVQAVMEMMQREKDPLSSTPAPASSSAAAAPKGDIPKHSSASSSSGGGGGGGGANRNVSAEEARAKLKKKMEAAMLDPNLPSAFKVANANRLAFARQQNRRKNNDTWVSLNSSHINKESERPVDYVDADGDSDDESFASMADDDSFIEEGDEEDED